VEKLLELWKQRTKNFEEIYREGLAIYNEMMSIKARQRILQLDDIAYNLLLILETELGKKSELIDDAKELYDSIDEQIGIKERKFPNWSLQLTVRKNVEKTIRQFIRKYVREYRISLDKMEKIYQRLIDYIIKNG
jgi:type I restriction enzyme R subunit